MASANVEFAAFHDPRFKLLGKLSGLSRFDAIGRMTAIWVYCIEKSRAQLSDAMIDALAEIDSYAVWVVEVGLGERLPDSQIRICGTDGRIEWLAKARARQKHATEAARNKRIENRSPKLDPKSDPKSGPTLASSSASASASRRRKIVDPSDTTLLWDYYSKKLQEKRSIEAVHSGGSTGKWCQQLTTRHGLEKAKKLVDAFLNDSGSFVRDRAWSLGLLVRGEQEYLARVNSGDLWTPLHEVKPV